MAGLRGGGISGVAEGRGNLEPLTKPPYVTLNGVKGLAFTEILRLRLRMTVVLLGALNDNGKFHYLDRGI